MSLLTLPAAGPAQAEAANSSQTLALLAPSYSISVPSSASLGSVSPGGSTADTPLGSVTVSANGSSLWTATVSATSFTTPPGGTGQTIANSNASYWSGLVVTKSGSGTFTPGQPQASNAATLAVSRTAFTRSGAQTANSVTWNPHLKVSVPLTSRAGTYTGTVTHSVA